MTDNKIIGAFKRLLTMTLALVMVLGAAMPLMTQESYAAFTGKKGSKYTVYDGGQIRYEKLHAKENLDKDHPVDRRTKEVEAESIAYTICQHYGLDSSDYSFSYVAGWSSGKEVKELKASLERIRSAADEMITGIDKALEKQAKREQLRAARDEAR